MNVWIHCEYQWQWAQNDPYRYLRPQRQNSFKIYQWCSLWENWKHSSSLLPYQLLFSNGTTPTRILSGAKYHVIFLALTITFPSSLNKAVWSINIKENVWMTKLHRCNRRMKPAMLRIQCLKKGSWNSELDRLHWPVSYDKRIDSTLNTQLAVELLNAVIFEVIAYSVKDVALLRQSLNR